MQRNNIYCCLYCGKYFQGRGKGTHAHNHCLVSSHQLYINLHSFEIFQLPENIQIETKELQDVVYNLSPFYCQQEIKELDYSPIISSTLEGIEYYPGYVGLNNLNRTGYANVIIQAVCRIQPIRDHLLKIAKINDSSKHSALIEALRELVCKIFNPQNFKGHVSPHQLMQQISIVSNKLFSIQQQSDPIQLFAFLVQQLQKHSKSLVSCLKGKLTKQQKQVEFKYISLQIPSLPLYKKDVEEEGIPHVNIKELLIQFMNRECQIDEAPRYMVFHFQRFVKNNFFVEKNPTIVIFPLINLDLSFMNISHKYNLIVNICHEGNNQKQGNYKVHVFHKAFKQWLEMQDLLITKIMPQQVQLSETYIQIYERQP